MFGLQALRALWQPNRPQPAQRWAIRRATRRAVRRPRLMLEELEDRRLLSGPADREQFMIELVNRMRIDPAAELQRILDANDPDVLSSLNFFGVNQQTLASQFAALSPAQPLAWHQALHDAAAAHSQLMLQHDEQSHQLPGEAALGTRVTNAGYSSFQSLGENVFAFAESVFHAHAAFAIDWGNGPGGIQSPPGHRDNLMDKDFREIGIGIVDSTAGKQTGPLLVTQDFGNRFNFGGSYVLGVVFNDADQNGFYSVGEGLSGVNIQVSNGGGSFSTQSMTAGGYQLQVPAGTYTVTFSGGGLASAITQNVMVGSSNVKIDAGVGLPAPTVGFSLVASSGSEATTPAALAVTLSNAQSSIVTVNYAVTGGTAAASGVDFFLTPGKLTFLPGQTSKIIPITIVNDARDEFDETIQVTLSNPVGVDLGVNPVHTFTILDNDAAPKVGFLLSSSLGSEALATANLTVALSTASNKPVTVDYAVTGGTATGGGVDYTLANGTLTFSPGQTRLSIPISIVNDALDEGAETIQVALTNLGNATLGTIATHTYVIVDGDPLPVVGFDLTASSGDEGVSPAILTVSLSAVSGRAVTVKFYTSGLTATPGSDYVAAAAPITFLPGETSKTIALDILDDTVDEADERFAVVLYGATNATLGDTLHVRTILDNDLPPTVAFAIANSATTELMHDPVITVTLSAASGKRISVNYTATAGSATRGLDYLLSGTRLVFQPGQTAKKIPLAVLNDKLDELDETAVLTLSAPTNANLGVIADHTLTILDDDGPPTVSFRLANSSGPESLVAATLLVSLSRISAKSVTVDYAPTGGTATNGADYNLSPGTLTFNPGELTRPIFIPIVNDTIDEVNETILVTLSNPVNADLGLIPTHTFTIIDNDAAPRISFVDRTSSGGETGSIVDFLVTLSAPSAKSITVNFGISGGTAKQGIDYLFSSGTLTFAPGETSKTISLSLVNDAQAELPETIRLSLSGVINALLGLNPVHTLTILDDDPAPSP